MEEQNQYQNQEQQPEVINNINSGANANTTSVEDKAPVGLKILSFFIPLVGLILFCINLKEKPKYAKGCGVPALVGFFVFPMIIVLVFTFILVTGVGLTVFNTAQDVTNDSLVAAQSEVEDFNKVFEPYEGNRTYTSVRTLMTLVTNNNLMDEEHQITVVLDDIEGTASEVRAEVRTGNTYKIKFGYDAKGFIDEVIITTN